MDALSAEFSTTLSGLGINKGSTVAVMLPKGPELMIVALAVWRLGAVYVPLFTAFGPDAINARVADAGAQVVVTDRIQRPKFAELGLVAGHHRIVTCSQDPVGLSARDTPFSLKALRLDAASRQDPAPPPISIATEDPFVLLYTSGTTGLPKGVPVPARALASFHAYMERGLGLSQTGRDQRYLSSADPAWAYGLYYNLIGPLLLGLPATYLSGPFDPRHLLRALQQLRVTHYASAPSAYRALKAADACASPDSAEIERAWADLGRTIQCTSSAGEPLNVEIIQWWRSRLAGRSVADHYGQTETGMLVNWHWGDAPKEYEDSVDPLWGLPGAMGRSMEGFRCVVLNEQEQEVLDRPGQLAVDLRHSPLMWFKGYWKNPRRSEECFSKCGRYYLTKDTVTHSARRPAEADGEGSAVTTGIEPVFWYSGRDDDVITSSGYRIGPFDVENTLMEDPRVVEVAVVGVPDPEGLRGEVVAAVVVLNESIAANQNTEAVAKELKVLVQTRLSRHCYPRVIRFVAALPKTPSGKVQKFKLKADLAQGTP